MARNTRQLLAGMLLSLAIVTGASTALRLAQGQTAEASQSEIVVACLQ